MRGMMKTRIKDWVNIKTWREFYSFQVFIDRKWCLLTDGKTLVSFKTEEERDRVQVLVRKAKTVKETAKIIEENFPEKRKKRK